MQLNSGFSCNSIIWLTSSRAGEAGPTRRMTEDLGSLMNTFALGFQVIDITSKKSFEEILIELTHHAKESRMRPILHIDMHGCAENGLFVCETNEYISWDFVVDLLRDLNVATQNNLCIVGAACYGLRAIMPIKLNQATPFFILLAPEEEVEVGFLLDNIFSFYNCLFQTGSIDTAYSRNLSDEFKYFHCEKMLFIAIARYIKEQCRGKGGQSRRERLLTEIFSDQSEESKSQTITETRSKLKESLKPDQSLLDRYAKKFLISRSCSFKFDELLNFVESA